MMTMRRESLRPRSFLSVVALVAATPALAQQEVTERVSVKTSGIEGNGDSFGVVLSGDGKRAAFVSGASNLVAGDKNGSSDIFLRDRVAATTVCVSVNTTGKPSNGASFLAGISADGRYVVFDSAGDDLVAGDTNQKTDVFLRDLQSGSTVRLSVDSSGNEVDGWSNGATISPDGTLVAFYSDATTLVAGDNNGVKDVFVRDCVLGTTERISVDSAGVEGNDHSFAAGDSGGFSSDGRYVLFESLATNLVAGDTNGFPDVFVHDRTTGVTERVSVDSAGNEANAQCSASSISRDGRLVAFYSLASNLVANDTNGTYDAFVHDRATGITQRVSVDSAGAEANGISGPPLMTADGRHVCFGSAATNLVSGDVNNMADIFVHDLVTGTTVLWIVDWFQGQGEGGVAAERMSDDGSVVAFSSSLTDLVDNDTNFRIDVFVAEHFDAAWTNYGAGFAGTNGIPSFTSSAAPVLGTSIQLDLANSLANPTVGLLFVGLQRTTLPTNFGGDLLVVPAWTLPISFSYGFDSFGFAVPNDPALAMVAIDLQAVEADSGAAVGVSFTAGLELILGF
jgi:Tol biopolymer transport system component